MKKGVNPVDILTEVRIPQMTKGNSSTQHPAVRSSGTWSRGFRPWRMLWLARSAWPLDSEPWLVLVVAAVAVLSSIAAEVLGPALRVPGVGDEVDSPVT